MRPGINLERITDAELHEGRAECSALHGHDIELRRFSRGTREGVRALGSCPIDRECDAGKLPRLVGLKSGSVLAKFESTHDQGFIQSLHFSKSHMLTCDYSGII
jgi:hypothetical protein